MWRRAGPACLSRRYLHLVLEQATAATGWNRLAGYRYLRDWRLERTPIAEHRVDAAAAAEQMRISDDTWTDWFLPGPRCEDEFRRTGDAAAAETGDDCMGCVVAVAGSCMSTTDSQLVMVDRRRG